MKSSFLLIILFSSFFPSVAQIIETVVGGGYGDNLPATENSLNRPQDVVIDQWGNIYIAELSNHIIKKVDAISNRVTVFAGTGINGFSGDGELAINARISFPIGLAADTEGNIYIADTGNERVRKVDVETGIISTVAGNGTYRFSGDGGQALEAGLSNFIGLETDDNNNIYIVDRETGRIRKVDAETGIINTVAGYDPDILGDGGLAIEGGLTHPSEVYVDANGNLYIADSGNFRIRFVDATTGIITTIAGTDTSSGEGDGGLAVNAKLDYPSDVVVGNNGEVYFTDLHRIRKIDPDTHIITTIAGSKNRGFAGDGGLAINALFDLPIGIDLDLDGNLLVAEDGNHRIRKIDLRSGVVSTIAGNDQLLNPGEGLKATDAQLYQPRALAVDSENNLYIGGGLSHTIRKVDKATGIITTIAGTGEPGFSGDNQLAINAQLNNPAEITFDNNDNLYFFDANNGRIRKIDAKTGLITTIAGNGSFSGEGIPAIISRLGSGIHLAVDDLGNIFLTESFRIRKIDNRTRLINTIAGNGVPGFSGDGGLATLAQIYSARDIVVDENGDLIFCDYSNRRIRKIKDGIITTIAGNGSLQFSPDGSIASDVSIGEPYSLQIDEAGNIYFSDYTNGLVRVIDKEGILGTVAGRGKPGYSGDGAIATKAYIYVNDLALDESGNIYILDTGNGRVRMVNAERKYLAAKEGSFWTQPGTYRPTTWLQGKVQFSFQVNVYPNSGKPYGTANVSFKKAPMYFRKTSLDNLDVSGNVTTLTGNGKIKNEGGYTFKIVYVDGDVDKVRIVIRATDGELVYDSQFGGGEEPSTIVSPVDSWFTPDGMPTMMEESIADLVQPVGYNVYPNPAKDRLTIQIPSIQEGGAIQKSTIIMMDMQGRIVKEIKTADSLPADINVEALNSGLYILKIEFKGHSSIEKIMISR